MKKTLTLALIVFFGLNIKAQVYTQTYSAGDINGVSQVQTSTSQVSPCPGVITFTGLPVGANIDSVRVEYDFFSTLAGFQSPLEQRSYINCPTTGVAESSLALAVLQSPVATIASYDRTISIANGPIASTSLTFELHAGTTSMLGGSCTGSGHVVLNNTWTITVYTSGSAACPAPDSISSTSTSNSIALDWVPGGTETQWDIAYGYAGTSFNAVPVVPVNNHPYTISSLDSATAYDFYVRASCSSTDSSLWVGPFTAMTDTPLCVVPLVGNVGNITQTSASVNWVQNGFSVDWEIEYGLQGFSIGSGTLISGAQSNPWVINGLSSATDYDVYVRNNCGLSYSDWHGPISFTTLDSSIGIPELEVVEQIYPNPSNGSFTFVASVNGAYSVRTIQGQVAAKGSLRKGKNRMDLELPPGFYFIVFNTRVFPVVLD
jgi:hypothetical protein